MPSGSKRLAPARNGENALTGEGTLLLVILLSIVALVGWLAWSGSEAAEEEARAYAGRTLDRILFEHDANYLATNLSPAARAGFPAAMQRSLISSLTNLGRPSAPLRITGSVLYGTEPGAHDPGGHYQTTAVFPSARVLVYLDVARRQGLWRIDYFAAQWLPPSEDASPAP